MFVYACYYALCLCRGFVLVVVYLCPLQGIRVALLEYGTTAVKAELPIPTRV